MISATLDSNVLIRALNFGGPAALLIGRAKAATLRIDVSEAILKETIGVLRNKFHQDPYALSDNHQKLEAICNVVIPTEKVSAVQEDPDDDRILECAQAARSDYVVSEDKDLLRRREFGGAPIVTIREFIQIALIQERR